MVNLVLNTSYLISEVFYFFHTFKKKIKMFFLSSPIQLYDLVNSSFRSCTFIAVSSSQTRVSPSAPNPATII